MKEHPILFSAPMIRAILANEKTQTRRVVRERADHHVSHVGWLENGHKGPGWYAQEVAGVRHMDTWIRCLYGAPGDRLWVRETFAIPPGSTLPGDVAYRADLSEAQESEEREARRLAPKLASENRWAPSIHMPRWASRISLEITDVRIERLQAISEEDARAEGVSDACKYEPDEDPRQVGYGPGGGFARDNFRALWDTINGDRAPWSSDPFVWVVAFRRVAQ